MNNRGAIALGAVVVVAAVVIVILAFGGPNTSTTDPTGDARLDKGRKRPADIALADVATASVTSDGAEITFEARLDGAVPRDLDEGSVSYQWSVEEEGRETWIVTADITIETTASVVATQKEFSVTTINSSLPGAVEVDGNAVAVTLDASQLEDFPTSFDWSLETLLDGDRSDTRSAEATDRMPDEGVIHFDG